MALDALAELVVGGQGTVDVEVEDVVVAGAFCFQMFGQGLVGGGPQQGDLHPQLGGFDGVDQGPGNSAVGDVAVFIGAGGDDQQPDDRGSLQGGRNRGAGVAFADQAAVYGQGTGQVGIPQSFPVQRLEAGALADDFQAHLIQLAPQPAIVAVGVGVGFKHLLEQLLAVALEALDRLFGSYEVEHGVDQPFFKIPFQLVFLVDAEGIGDSDGIFAVAIKAETGDKTLFGLLLLAQGDGGHGGGGVLGDRAGFSIAEGNGERGMGNGE